MGGVFSPLVFHSVHSAMVIGQFSGTATQVVVYGASIVGRRCCIWCFYRGASISCIHFQCTSKFVSRSGGQPPVRKGAEEHEAILISNKVKAFSKLWICDVSRFLLLGDSVMWEALFL